MKKLLLLMLSAPLLAQDPDKSNAWSQVPSPLGGSPQAIGSYANGCQSGAVQVAAEGPGYKSIRRWRNRFYTQPVTRELIESVGQALGPRQILIGDMSQPLGGPMPFGHASHQNGLDVDFWFYSVSPGEAVPAELEPPTMADLYNGRLFQERWRPEYRQALWAAAQFPETARIFVNPVIKDFLCQTESDRSWLRKVRPWKGHDSHFHVRLNCPAVSFSCENQAPLPPGDGCNDDLKKWVRDQALALQFPKPAKKSKQAKGERLPHPQCAALLADYQNRAGAGQQARRNEAVNGEPARHYR